MSINPVHRRFTVDEYHKMAEAGILGEDDRVELLEGEIVQMSPIGRRHAAHVKRINRIFTRTLGDRAVVGVQDPVRLDEHSEPQPDVVLLRPRADFYEQGHPGPEDVLLLVEVAETSLDADRDYKLPLYARNGIAEVWIVDIAGGVVEVNRRPGPTGYSESVRRSRRESLTVAAFSDTSFPVDEILGSA